MVGEVPPSPPAIPDCIPEEDNCSYVNLEGADHSYLPPEVFALTWHADVGNIMHMVPCIAYCSAWIYIFYWKVKCVWNFLNITYVQILQIVKFIS